jgi:GNAT superfamily N-acetyltransferase
MIQVYPGQVTPALRALFDPDDPASLRGCAVLYGNAAGRILTDNPESPAWGLVQEAAFGTLYLGGALDRSLLQRIVAKLLDDGDVLVGLWPEDRRFHLLPSGANYDGSVLEFTDRPVGEGLTGHLGHMPDGCEIRHMDRSLFERCDGRYLYMSIFGSVDQALENGFGMCLMKDNAILCEAFAGPAARGQIEVGTQTGKEFRGRGFATLTCAYLVQWCEQQGYQTYWNCDKNNLASAAVARKLGYQVEREYRLLAWSKN